MLPPVAVAGTCLSLRVLRPATQDLAALWPGPVRSSRRPLSCWPTIIEARLAFLVSGGTGAGKTTLLAAALGAVTSHERIVCVEDAPELAPRHPHLVRLVARTANVEGVGEITLRQLVRQALRMRPDRIVVGEVRGAEVVDLLAALNTGHDGGAGTVHANSPAEVPARLEALAALGGLDRAALHSQLAAAVQVLLHVSRGGDGRRRLSEIALLRRDEAGRVPCVTAWHVDRGRGVRTGQLTQLIRDRRRGERPLIASGAAGGRTVDMPPPPCAASGPSLPAAACAGGGGDDRGGVVAAVLLPPPAACRGSTGRQLAVRHRRRTS